MEPERGKSDQYLILKNLNGRFRIYRPQSHLCNQFIYSHQALSDSSSSGVATALISPCWLVDLKSELLQQYNWRHLLLPPLLSKQECWNQKLIIPRRVSSCLNSWRVHGVHLVHGRLRGDTAHTTLATTWAWTSTTLRSFPARSPFSLGWPSRSNQVGTAFLQMTDCELVIFGC